MPNAACQNEDFDEFELFVKSTLNGTADNFFKNRHKIITDDADDEIVTIKNRSDNLYRRINNCEDIIINDSGSSLCSYRSSATSSSNTSNNTTSRLRKRKIANAYSFIEDLGVENIITDSPILNSNNPDLDTTNHYTDVSASSCTSSANTSAANSNIGSDNKRSRLATNNNNTSGDEIIIIDEEPANNGDQSDVMVIGAKISSTKTPYGSLPVERFLNDHFPQWRNPKDDLVVGPSLVFAQQNPYMHLQKLSREIPKYMAPPDDDCVLLTPSETQECLWREKFLDTLEYLLRCPICYRTVHRIGQSDSYRGPNTDVHISRLMYSTKCGHIFCGKCIEYVRKKKQCAICRKPIKDKNQYHQLFP